MRIRKKSIDYEYNMNGVILESAEAEKDHDITWSENIQPVCESLC